MVIDVKIVEEWLKIIVSIGTALGFLYGKLVKPVRAIQEQQQILEQKINNVIEDVAFLQGDRLQQAYKHHTRAGWCSPSDKKDLERWYTSYKAAGHNHLAEHYLDTILALPDAPQN